MSDIISVFSTEQASRLCGLSVGTLSNWEKSGLLGPGVHSGAQGVPFARAYTFKDLVALKTLQRLRKVYKFSRSELMKAGMALQDHARHPWSELTLYVVNREIHFHHPEGGIRGSLSGQKTFPTIPLASIEQEMREVVRLSRARKPETHGTFESHRFVASNQDVFTGTRIPIDLIVSLHAAGWSRERILRDYPSLSEEDIALALERTSTTGKAA
jgi:uncharacterized protein (DUF433 family)/DNA-binding transcriptional MerR regulator